MRTHQVIALAAMQWWTNYSSKCPSCTLVQEQLAQELGMPATELHDQFICAVEAVAAHEAHVRGKGGAQ
jgi:hypothetical protein